MPLADVEQEVRRFLTTSTPEVLCIKGKWGVGKTYAWKRYVNEVNDTKKLALSAYSYVSLFGLNSLDALRFAVFENTVSAEHVASGADASTFEALFAKGSDLGRKARPIVEAVASFFGRKGISDVLFQTAFLAVRNQFVCFDDLERAGSGLEIRDVLGLASFLKEERHCNVALLLNEERLDANERVEFNRQLEKVADTTVVLDPTPDEAVKIAFPTDGEIGKRLSPRIIELGITNIRVIKKIERLADRLVTILAGMEKETTDQALTALVLGSWSVQQPDIAPPLDFIRKYNTYAIAAGGQAGNANEEAWRSALNKYPYRATDELDGVVLDGVASGYFDAERLKKIAGQLEARRKKSEDNAFGRAWQDMYHGSLSTDDDEFLDALYEASLKDAAAITPNNINSAVRLLRDMHRDAQANEVIAKYIEVHRADGRGFFDLAADPFVKQQELDVTLEAAFAEELASYVDSRDPLEVLRAISERQTWTDDDVALMARQGSAEFEAFFETLQGVELRRSIELLQGMSRGGYEGSQAIGAAVTEALKKIGGKSPLRARKVARYGVKVEKNEVPPAATD